MKRISILALALVALVANAFAHQSSNVFYHKPDKQKTESRAENGYDLRFCGDLYTWYRTVSGSNYTYRIYLAIPADMATQLAGNEITDITFSPYLQSGKKQATVFVSENLDADPITTAVEEVSKGVAVTVGFETPYVIKEGQAFYFGYTISGCGDSDYPIGIDYTEPTDFSGYIEATKNGKTETYTGADLDANVFLYAHTVGEKEGLIDVFSIGNIYAAQVSSPVVTNCSNVKLQLPITNFGANAITSIKYIVDGTQSFEQELDVPAVSNVVVELPVGSVEPGAVEMQVQVESINGIAGEYEPNIVDFFAIRGDGYPKRFVVEELTGSWCGYCPMGIVGFEYMTQTYPEDFIGIAAHVDDSMAVTSYETLNLTMGKQMGYPSCWANRDPIYYFQPDAEVLEIVHDIFATQRAIAKVDLDVYYFDGVLTAHALTKFDVDFDDAQYALAFVILEDGYTDKQVNYYAGGSYGEMAGWENMKSKVDWTYEHVARDIFSYSGLSESVPASIERNAAYIYTYDLDLRNVQDVAKTSVVALLLNTATGEIVNASEVKADDYLLTGIADAIGDSFVVKGGDGKISIDSQNATAYIYNIAGQKIACVQGDASVKLNAGIYIVRIGNKIQKVIVK